MKRQGPLLEVRDLNVYFDTPDGAVHAVADMSYSVDAGKTLAIIGESGCGKSTSARVLLRLLPTHNLRVTGQAMLDGLNLIDASESKLRSIRGNRVSVIFQDALSSLNPLYPVGQQIAEMYRIHKRCSKSEAKEKAIDWLSRVGIPSPAHRARDYPHRFSGGMRQRIVIAMALALEPELLIADEPTTALDATVQSEIIELLKLLQAELGMGMIMITHDLGVAADVADEAIVMYAGRVVERTSIARIYTEPSHPYTVGLLGSLPRWDQKAERLVAIAGSPPVPIDMPPGCPFEPRCWMATPICKEEFPPDLVVAPGHSSLCHHAHKLREMQYGSAELSKAEP